MTRNMNRSNSTSIKKAQQLKSSNNKKISTRSKYLPRQKCFEWELDLCDGNINQAKVLNLINYICGQILTTLTLDFIARTKGLSKAQVRYAIGKLIEKKLIRRVTTKPRRDKRLSRYASLTMLKLACNNIIPKGIIKKTLTTSQKAPRQLSKPTPPPKEATRKESSSFKKEPKREKKEYITLRYYAYLIHELSKEAGIKIETGELTRVDRHNLFKLQNRLGSIEAVIEYLKQAMRKKWLYEDKASGWKASASWIIRPENVTSIQKPGSYEQFKKEKVKDPAPKIVADIINICASGNYDETKKQLLAYKIGTGSAFFPARDTYDGIATIKRLNIVCTTANDREIKNRLKLEVEKYLEKMGVPRC